MTAAFQIIAGFLPLLDSAILVAAREKGFAAQEGIDLSLTREISWANIRDRMAVGHFHAAQMLAPMPIAANLGLTALAVPLIAPMALGLGGNAITASTGLWHELLGHGATEDLDPAATGAALASVIAERRRRDAPSLRLAVVHPHSGHNYELRYWLAAAGIDPDRDVEIVIAPPPLLPDALATGSVDGYCVGEPWNTVAVRAGFGRIVTVKQAIWRASPEKVLALHAGWAAENPQPVAALIRALFHAARWADDAANHQELAEILSRSTYLGGSPAALLPALSGRLDLGAGDRATVAGFFSPYADHATFPWQSHALWFYSQMARWKDAEFRSRDIERAAASYRPDLYRAALSPLGIALPERDWKIESGFFDGKAFDPAAFEAYFIAQRAALDGSA